MDIRFFCRVMKKCFSRTTQPTIAGSNKDGWLHEMLKRVILEDEYKAEEEQPACVDDFLRHAFQKTWQSTPAFHETCSVGKHDKECLLTTRIN